MQKRMIYSELRAKKRSGGDGKEECPYSLYILYARASKAYAVKHTAGKGKSREGRKGQEERTRRVKGMHPQGAKACRTAGRKTVSPWFIYTETLVSTC